jgi:hypothetical protein
MYVSQHLTKGPGTDDGRPPEAHDGPMPSRTRQSRCQQIIDLIDDTLAEYERTRPTQHHPVKEALR